MKCDYNDGFKVDYSGELRISKGKDVEIMVRGSQINAQCRQELEAAALHNSCSDLRAAAREVTDIFHEAWDKQ